MAGSDAQTRLTPPTADVPIRLPLPLDRGQGGTSRHPDQIWSYDRSRDFRWSRRFYLSLFETD